MTALPTVPPRPPSVTLSPAGPASAARAETCPCISPDGVTHLCWGICGGCVACAERRASEKRRVSPITPHAWSHRGKWPTFAASWSHVLPRPDGFREGDFIDLEVGLAR